jgi:hypothetical protein
MSRFKDGCRSQIFTPVLARLLRPRWQAWVIIATALLLLLSSQWGWSLWPCPIKSLTGIPCPGCGLNRAIRLLLAGDWRASLIQHAFAPFFLLGLIVLLIVSLLPDPVFFKVLGWLEKVERRTGITSILLLLLIIYWIARLIFLGFDFA